MLAPPERIASSTFLETTDWFSSLPSNLRNRILERSQLRRFEARDIVYGAHQPPLGFWMLLQGQVVVAEVFPDGERFLYHIGGPGFCFGGASLLASGRSGVEVTASTKARVLLLPTSELDRIFVEQPSLYRLFAELIMRRYYLVLRCLARSRTLPPEQYLRLRLALLCELWRQDGYAEPVIEVAISQSEAASLLGISRQTLNRYLSKLEAEGLVEVCFRTIRVLRPEHLCSLATEDLVP